MKVKKVAMELFSIAKKWQWNFSKKKKKKKKKIKKFQKAVYNNLNL